MTETMLPVPEVPPLDAVVAAKCHRCMIEFTGRVNDMQGVKPKLSVLGTWIWVTDCPKCFEMMCFAVPPTEEAQMTIYILESRVRTTVETPWGAWKQANAAPFDFKEAADDYLTKIGPGNKWIEFRVMPYTRVEA